MSATLSLDGKGVDGVRRALRVNHDGGSDLSMRPPDAKGSCRWTWFPS